MGSFINNCHVFTNSPESAGDALTSTITANAYITVSGKNWVSVFPDENDSVPDIAQALSAALSTCAIAIMVHDSDVLLYWLYEDGVLTDEYNSKPDYFEGAPGEDGEDIEPVDENERLRAGGTPEILSKYSTQGVPPNTFRDILQGAESDVFVESSLTKLGEALGIDGDCVNAAMRYLENDDTEIDMAQLTPVSPRR